MDTSLLDPLGRRVNLHDRTWYGHIVVGHPEVKGHRNLVEAAVTNSMEVRISRTNPDCRLYFGSGPWPGVMIVVVADLSLGLVKTAYLAKKVSGGSVEWSPPTPSKA